MIFGMFGGDRKLEAQRAALRDCTQHLESLEERLSGVDAIRAQFADVWPDEGVPNDLLARVARSRELVDLLALRAASAKRELPKFDESVEFLKQQLPALDRRWKAFTAMLLARQTILQGDVPNIPPTERPSMRDCQIALLGIAEGLYGGLRRHVDELTAIKPRHDGPWPEQLNLANMEAGMTDVRGALEVWRERLGDGRTELPEAANASFMDIVSMLRNSILIVEDHRAQLAMHTATKAALRNAGHL
jgi:hypothetical protein